MRYFILASLVVLPALSLAQLPSPELDTIFPPGGKAGTTIAVELGGNDLDELSGLRFTHPGITAEPVILPADEIWPEPRADGLKFTVRVADDVPPGRYEVRTEGRFGSSTPRFFIVSPKGGSAEVTITDGNETIETATPIELEQPVNAQTSANRSDHYKLPVRQGQRVLVHVWGERIDSRIDAMLSILDPSGREIATSLNEIGLDPLGDFTAPADGEYTIKVSDYLYNGGPPYYYRMEATTRPWLDGSFPPAGRAGSRQKFILYGRNLPGGQPSGCKTARGDPLETKEVEIDIPTAGDPATIDGGKVLQSIAEGFDHREGSSNPLRIGLARDELIVEDAGSDEQLVSAPCEVVGRFDASGDQDRYRFTCAKDEALVIEVTADRMAIPVDPTLILQQVIAPAPGATEQAETSKFIAEADDIVMASLIPQDGVGFDTRSRDARLLFTAPEDGDYRVVLGNNMSYSGELAAYRLGIRKARPGFRLIAVQDGKWQEGRNAMAGVTQVHAGGTSFIRILALREDGFDGPIELSVSGLPTGVFAPPIAIWGSNDEGYVAITAASHAQDWSGEVQITGRASIGGESISVPALTGTLVWSAQDPTKNRTRSRLTTSFAMQVSSEPAGLVLQPKEQKIWRVELGKTLEIPVKLTKAAEVKAPFNVTPYGLPGFTRPPNMNISGEEGVVKLNFSPNGNSRPIAGQGRFLFRLDGVRGKYRINPEGAEYWRSRQQEIDALSNRLNQAKGKADNAANQANSARGDAERELGEHENARNKLAQALADTQSKHDAARREMGVAETAARAVPEAWLAAAKATHEATQAERPTLERAAEDANKKSEAAKQAAGAAKAALDAELAAAESDRKALLEAIQTAKVSLQASRDTVAAAETALADHLAPRVEMANAAAREEVRWLIAKQAAALAASEIVQVTAEHEAAAMALAEAKTKADAALKKPEEAFAKASKAVTDKERDKLALEHALAETGTKDADTAVAAATKRVADAESMLVALRKTQAEAQTDLAEAQMAATEAAAAITAEEKSYTDNLAKLSAARDRTAQALQEAEPIFRAAAARVADYDTGGGGLDQALADAKSKIEPARKALADAEAKLMETEHAHDPALAKLTAGKRSADLALIGAEIARKYVERALAENLAATASTGKILTEAQAAVEAGSTAAAGGDPVSPETIAGLAAAASTTAATVAITASALDVTRQALEAHDAARPILEQAAAEAATRADAAKAEATRLADLVTRSNAAKQLAATEARNAQNRANEKDVKFTVFSEPIDLRISDPPAKK